MDRTKEQVMRRSTVFVLACLLLLACKSQEARPDMAGREELSLKQDPSYTIEHMVFFNLKDNVTETDIKFFKDQIRSLNQIAAVGQLIVSESQDLDDPRALDYDLVMKVYFSDRANMDLYLNHPVHLAVKQRMMPYLEKAPSTLDLQPE